jgi:hypothetical protein
MIAKKQIAIIGSGPSALIAAEYLAEKGFAVDVFERKKTIGRKFLFAGLSGLNLTHAEPLDAFIARYHDKSAMITKAIINYPPEKLCDWCKGLGQELFVGTSGRVFPKAMKASPLLRAWQARLLALGVTFHLEHDWQGWDDDALIFKTNDSIKKIKPDATLLALGGASWPHLGTDGSWVKYLQPYGVDIHDLKPSNCGFHVNWSDYFKSHFAHKPLKNIALHHHNHHIKGELMVTEHGLEGGALYALSPSLRDEYERLGFATVFIDLKPDLTHAEIEKRLSISKRLSLPRLLKEKIGLSDLATALLYETENMAFASLSLDEKAKIIKAYPLQLAEPFDIKRAISSSGGIALTELDEHFMLRKKKGVFCAGEMLDWDAPTGGYLLQACFSTGAQAAKGMMAYLEKS